MSGNEAMSEGREPRDLASLARIVFMESRAWRSSVPFVTLVVAVGLALDSLNANIVVAVFPFRLEALNYHDVSGLVGWLLFLYSIALVISTPVIAITSERLGSRRGIMLFGQGCLMASQLLLMFAPKFWVMCIGRFLEGIASAVIMTAGLALICDTTPEKAIGGQLGIAMIGMPLGGLVGPPVGGALYDRWGYRAPFIFSILFTLFDVTCRLLVVEKPINERTLATLVEQSAAEKENIPPEQPTIALEDEMKDAAISENATNPNLEGTLFGRDDGALSEIPQVSALEILVQFVRSPRMLTCLVVVFICSFAFSAADVAIPLRLQDIWHFNSRKVGLAYLAAIIPTLISNPLAGFLSDWCGPQWIAILFVVCGTPWWGAMTTTFSLPFFIVSFGIENFFIGAVAPPITSELAAVTKTMKGVGYAHTYGTFNIVLGVANAAGSIVAGQVYGHSRRGWDILCYIHIGLLAFTLLAVMLFIGETPFLRGGWKLKNAPFRRATLVDASQEASERGPGRE